MGNPLQNYEFNLRIALTQIEYMKYYLKRIPDPMAGEESPLLDALHALDAAVYNIKQWAEKNDVEVRESMKT